MRARSGQNERRRLPPPCPAVLPGSPAQRRAGCCPHCCPRRAGVGATARPPLAAAAPRALFPCWREGLQFNLAEALSDALYLPYGNSAAGKSRQLLQEKSGSWRRHGLSLPSPRTSAPGAMASARGVAPAAGQHAPPLHIQCHRGHPQAGTAAATALSQPGMTEGISSSLGLDLGNDPPGWEVFAPRSPQTRGDFSYPWQSFHLPSSLSVDGVVFSCH